MLRKGERGKKRPGHGKKTKWRLMWGRGLKKENQRKRETSPQPVRWWGASVSAGFGQCSETDLIRREKEWEDRMGGTSEETKMWRDLG